MKQRNRILFYLAVSSVMIVLASSVRSAYSQPRAESPEEQARTVLSSADTIKVEIEIVECYGDEGPTCGSALTVVTKLNPKELKPIISDLALGDKMGHHVWGTSVTPIIYFTFLEKGTSKGVLSVGYGYDPYDYCFNIDGSNADNRQLAPKTVQQLRHLIAGNKKIVKALRDMQCDPKMLNPDYIRPTEKAQK